jgi:hypothetical protein
LRNSSSAGIVQVTGILSCIKEPPIKHIDLQL